MATIVNVVVSCLRSEALLKFEGYNDVQITTACTTMYNDVQATVKLQLNERFVFKYEIAFKG